MQRNAGVCGSLGSHSDSASVTLLDGNKDAILSMRVGHQEPRVARRSPRSSAFKMCRALLLLIAVAIPGGADSDPMGKAQVAEPTGSVDMQLLPSCQKSLVALSQNGSALLSATPLELKMWANDLHGRPIDQPAVRVEVRVQGIIVVPSWRRVVNEFTITLPAEPFEVSGDYELLVTLIGGWNESAGAIRDCEMLTRTLRIEAAPSPHVGVLVGAAAATVLLVGVTSAGLKRNYQRVRMMLGALINEVSRHYISMCFELVDVIFDWWVTYQVFFHGETSKLVSNGSKTAYASFLFTATFFYGIMLIAHHKVLRAVFAGRKEESDYFVLPVPAKLQNSYESEMLKNKRLLYWLELVVVSMCVQNIPYTVLGAILVISYRSSDMIVCLSHAALRMRMQRTPVAPHGVCRLASPCSSVR